MPVIVDYETVLERMRLLRMRCQYYNSGAFGPEPGEPMHFVGWIGPDDPTIRPAALERARKVNEPYEATLTNLVTRAWREFIPGPAWIMPKSNWAYELDFGSKTWLPNALRSADLDPAKLQSCTNSPAIEFAPAEIDLFTPIVSNLLENLRGSDFAVAFPESPVTCTLHHHKQVWWISSDDSLIARLEQFATAQ